MIRPARPAIGLEALTKQRLSRIEIATKSQNGREIGLTDCGFPMPLAEDLAANRQRFAVQCFGSRAEALVLIHATELGQRDRDDRFDRAFTGKVTRISPAVNTGTRAFPFEAVVPNADGALKPGTFARVHVESAKVDEVLTLPYAALQYRYGVNRVFVVTGDKLEMRELQVGERLGDRIEVTAGVNWWLNPNTRIGFNWVHAMPEFVDEPDGDMDAFVVRFQVDF